LAIHKIRKNHPDKHTSIEVSNFNFLDIETTGLRPDRGSKITEVVILDRNNVKYEWISTNCSDNTSLHLALPRIISFFDKAVVVGHNLSFDFWFISYEADRIGIASPSLRFIDTLSLARKILPGRSSYTLGNLLKLFDIHVSGELHTAVTDAEATRALFWKLIEKGGISTVGEAGMKRLNWSSF